MWIMFLNSYVWAAAHLDKDGDQSQRVLRNMDVDQIQKVFTTTLNQVQSLQETALSGLRDQLDWTERPWKSRTLITVVADICKQTCMSSRILFYASAENVPNLHDQDMLGRRLRISSRLQKYRERHRRRAGRVQVESFPRAHYARASPGSRSGDERRDQHSAA